MSSTGIRLFRRGWRGQDTSTARAEAAEHPIRSGTRTSGGVRPQCGASCADKESAVRHPSALSRQFPVVWQMHDPRCAFSPVFRRGLQGRSNPSLRAAGDPHAGEHRPRVRLASFGATGTRRLLKNFVFRTVRTASASSTSRNERRSASLVLRPAPYSMNSSVRKVSPSKRMGMFAADFDSTEQALEFLARVNVRRCRWRRLRLLVRRWKR